jgi:hypothetical protein
MVYGHLPGAFVGLTVLSATIPLGACASTTTYVVERVDASAPLAGSRRVEVVVQAAPDRPAVAAAFARALSERLALARFEVVGGDGDVTLGVWIDALVPEAGRATVRWQLAREDGSSTSGAPAQVETTPLSEQELIARAADALTLALTPGPPERIEVEWEGAGAWDADAQERMAAGDVAGALASLEGALGRARASAVDAETLAALHFDLAVCLDALGRLSDAERALDEALTLHGTERHIEALQELRRRLAQRGGSR